MGFLLFQNGECPNIRSYIFERTIFEFEVLVANTYRRCVRFQLKKTQIAIPNAINKIFLLKGKDAMRQRML